MVDFERAGRRGQAVDYCYSSYKKNSSLQKRRGVTRNPAPFYLDFLIARVAELVDAHDSDSCPINGVQVQLLPRAPSFRGGIRL